MSKLCFFSFLRQIKKLKDCFGSLDGDGSGAIGIEELEDPLIGSGMIEFSEFLGIIKNSDGNEKTAKINTFFKDMTSGKLKSEGLSFNLLVTKLRRDYMMDAILSGDPKKKEIGDKILKNVGKQLQS